MTRRWGDGGRPKQEAEAGGWSKREAKAGRCRSAVVVHLPLPVHPGLALLLPVPPGLALLLPIHPGLALPMPGDAGPPFRSCTDQAMPVHRPGLALSEPARPMWRGCGCLAVRVARSAALFFCPVWWVRPGRGCRCLAVRVAATVPAAAAVAAACAQAGRVWG